MFEDILSIVDETPQTSLFWKMAGRWLIMM
jgi:hypothetical protein